MLCFTCHGTTAAGATTNVMDGKLTTNSTDLLGGGFITYKGAAATSSHSVDGSRVNAWGAGWPDSWYSTYECLGCHSDTPYGVWPGIPTWGVSGGAVPDLPGQGENVTMPLTCTSCHEPHGGRNYRMLQQRLHPENLQQSEPATVFMDRPLVTSNETGGQNPNQTGYVPDYTTPNYKLGLGDWCTGCHYTYGKTTSTQPFNAEDGKGLVTRYRHQMNMTTGGNTTTLPLEHPTVSDGGQVFCLSCHYAHGTSAAMTGQAANVAPANDSTLLRMDNRGVCEDCHKK